MPTMRQRNQSENVQWQAEGDGVAGCPDTGAYGLPLNELCAPVASNSELRAQIRHCLTGSRRRTRTAPATADLKRGTLGASG